MVEDNASVACTPATEINKLKESLLDGIQANQQETFRHKIHMEETCRLSSRDMAFSLEKKG